LTAMHYGRKPIDAHSSRSKRRSVCQLNLTLLLNSTILESPQSTTQVPSSHSLEKQASLCWKAHSLQIMVRQAECGSDYEAEGDKQVYPSTRFIARLVRFMIRYDVSFLSLSVDFHVCVGITYLKCRVLD
jgi:hypothetical protein